MGHNFDFGSYKYNIFYKQGQMLHDRIVEYVLLEVRFLLVKAKK